VKTFDKTPEFLMSSRGSQWNFLLDGKARLIEKSDFPDYTDMSSMRSSIFVWCKRHHPDKRIVTSLRDEGLYVQMVPRS
jgi:hypothetical protein